ncbi:MAG: RusA family crossover junction endodeoxyribonuclease, partial [Sulfurimonas sp.]
RRGDGTVPARVYEPSKSAAAKDAIVLEARRCIKAQGWQCFDGEPLALLLVARFPIPASASKARRALLLNQPHAQKPDVDNVVKLALDALTMAGAWIDDKQVTTVVARALWDEAPSLELQVHLDADFGIALGRGGSSRLLSLHERLTMQAGRAAS